MSLFLRIVVVSGILLGIGYIFALQVRFKRLAEDEQLERFKNWVPDKGSWRIIRWTGVIALSVFLISFSYSLFMEYNEQEELSRRETNQEMINELSKVPSGQLIPDSLLYLVPNNIDNCRFQFDGSSVQYGRDIKGDRIEEGESLVVKWKPSWVSEGASAFGIFALTNSFGTIGNWRVVQYGEKTRVSFEENLIPVFRGITFGPQTGRKALNSCSFKTIRKE